MALLLGIDTGGTYTDAVILDDETEEVIASAKALTTRPDLSFGISEAMDRVLQNSGARPADIALVSMSTTLATNALVEGKGGRIALVFIGFDEADLDRADLKTALGDDPVILLGGGHHHGGDQIKPLDLAILSARLESISGKISGVAIAARFATRNPSHEQAARDLVRDRLGVPVTCSHELSKSLGGPKRALTAVLNARLIGMIDRLVSVTQTHMDALGITAPLMVVRGDGALVPAWMARERPIETILSGPAASVAGAQWLTGARNALVSDIGGTTTDICLLRDGFPKIDPEGAKVGPFRTMVEAVAMRTFGLGGDSEVTVQGGLGGGLNLGPRRVMPVSLLAKTHPDLVHDALDRALGFDVPPEMASRFILATWDAIPDDLDRSEAAIAVRLASGPRRWADAVTSRIEEPAMMRLVTRGLAMVADITPSDASHVLGQLDAWDADAARKALALVARRRTGSGERVAQSAEALAQSITQQLVQQTVLAVLETAFAEEGWDDPAALARHPIVGAGLMEHSNVARISAGLAIPLIGLGASAPNYYRAVGEALNCDTVLPKVAGVANAIGAVVGQVSYCAEGSVTNSGEGTFRVHSEEEPVQFADRDAAMAHLRAELTSKATALAKSSGVEIIRITESLDLRDVQVEAQTMFIEATLRIAASGRPRITR